MSDEQPAAAKPGGAAARRPERAAELRVSTLEIFFDLVFAFTLTQLTSVLADRPGPARPRALAAVVALATTAVGAAAGLEVQLILVAVVLIAPLVADRERVAAGGGSPRGSTAG